MAFKEASSTYLDSEIIMICLFGIELNHIINLITYISPMNIIEIVMNPKLKVYFYV